MSNIATQIAVELNVKENQVSSTITLLDDGATVPFIARYRKEITGGLDDTQLRNLTERLGYLRELDERRETILSSIHEQGKLDAGLKKAILAVKTKTELEDLYLPFKKKRRTKAQIAREAGLEPLALTLLNTPNTDLHQEAGKYINKEKAINDSDGALDGARQILMEQFSEDAKLLGQLRDYLWQQVFLIAKLAKGKESEGGKFRDYFDYHEAIKNIPSHRALALFRGRSEGILRLSLKLENEDELKTHPCETMIARHFDISQKNRLADSWLLETVRQAWKIRIFNSLDVELKSRLKENAQTQAIEVFAANIKALLLAAPAGALTTMGLDPGLRTGVKVAIVDDTGKLLDTATIYPHVPQKKWQQSIDILLALCRKHHVKLISIGNGTGSRETDRLVSEMITLAPKETLRQVMVSEAGASVYSASALAALEFPSLDVSIRGAVSIARRLQDPLAELVKIEPKAIGVGQYQHDVNQVQLARKLNTVVEDCVNAVGVDVNMASSPLLSQVAGLNIGLADSIVEYRNKNGAFKDRQGLRSVPRLGPKAFEQAGGFLRVVNGDNPLDNSGVHPEAYPVVELLMSHSGLSLKAIIGNKKLLQSVEANLFTSDKFGVPTVTDILQELEKPGRDPRPEFKTAVFKDNIEKIADLKIDMILEGVVTNVTNFGAFVDVGVHQDGLVHISMLADKYIKDPHAVVKTGDIVTAKVMSVDLERKRIALTMRLADDSREHQATHGQQPLSSGSNDSIKKSKAKKSRNNKSNKAQNHSPVNSSMADAFAKALKK